MALGGRAPAVAAAAAVVVWRSWLAASVRPSDCRRGSKQWQGQVVRRLLLAETGNPSLK